jgi:hypothetical protein
MRHASRAADPRSPPVALFLPLPPLDLANAVPGFEAWLRGRLRDNLPFDRLATELLTVPLDGRQAPIIAVDGVETDDAANPLAFYTAK